MFEVINKSINDIRNIIDISLPKLVGQQKQNIILFKGAYNGREAWKTLKSNTVRKKKNSDIWMDTGKTYTALGDFDTIAIDEKYAIKDSTLPDYVSFVDKGTKNMEARPLLNFTPQDITQLTQQLKEQIAAQVNNG